MVHLAELPVPGAVDVKVHGELYLRSPVVHLPPVVVDYPEVILHARGVGILVSLTPFL